MLVPIALALVLAGHAQAQAQPTAVKGPMTPQQRFAAADTNHDGKVDKQEFAVSLNPDARPYYEAIFNQLDKNHDGWLSLDEMTYNGPPPGARLRVQPQDAAGK